MSVGKSSEQRSHWEEVYSSKFPEQVSWYESYPAASLNLIHASGLAHDSRIVDVGGGASTLVDHLLIQGFKSVTVLDIAKAALERSQCRLRACAPDVTWIASDVTTWRPRVPFDLWHDRAVFHFLTKTAQRRGYIEVLQRGVRPGGSAVIATFAPDGPERCSGLPVRRYSPEVLASEMGPGFALQEIQFEDHITPAGTVQRFLYCRFRRFGDVPSDPVQ